MISTPKKKSRYPKMMKLKPCWNFSHQKKDPDIIITSNGDQILSPYLLYRSKINGVTDKLEQNINREQPKNLNREGIGSSATTSLHHPRLFIMAEYHFPRMRNKIQTHH